MLGGRTVNELAAVLSSSELFEWGAWFTLKHEAEKQAVADAKNNTPPPPSKGGGGKRKGK